MVLEAAREGVLEAAREGVLEAAREGVLEAAREGVLEAAREVTDFPPMAHLVNLQFNFIAFSRTKAG